ncbi:MULTISPECIES: GntR family transcriptional regulator [unclassified Sulfitobacter]|uniref:GntR family transcriptional regulator n=3 Tax=Sulfitobacter TaxID=60136 RepID=UPI000B1A8882|nr:MULTISPECIES: GntR family transcriptional regulator [unclassified Sulfitobacter]|tara:strand:- start:1049 stop:1798 length:750 start_codon:yes stop_codon:yes gene_type:complete
MTKLEDTIAEREGSQSEIVRQALGEDIMTGQLKPGEFLSEGRIAERFGVSRTPVREAIRSLSGDGLVTLRPNQRAVVRGQTAAEILDQFEAMAELEAACTRLAARRRSESVLARMEAAQAECRARADSTDPHLYYVANVKFHEAIYEAAENDYLRSETLKLRDRLRFLRISQGHLPGRLAGSSSEHDAVLSAIREHKEAEAAEAMRMHLIVQGESLRSMLQHTDATGIVHLAEMQPGFGHSGSYEEIAE